MMLDDFYMKLWNQTEFRKQYLNQSLFVKDRTTRNQALSRETGKANTPKCLVREERILNMT